MLTSWPSCLTSCWGALTSTWLAQAVQSSTMVVAKGCADDAGAYHHSLRAHHRLSSTPPSPTQHTCYINTRAAAIERSWSLVHSVTTPPPPPLPQLPSSASRSWSNRLHGLSTSTELAWYMLLRCQGTDYQVLHANFTDKCPDLLDIQRGILWRFLGPWLHRPRNNHTKVIFGLSWHST